MMTNLFRVIISCEKGTYDKIIDAFFPWNAISSAMQEVSEARNNMGDIVSKKIIAITNTDETKIFTGVKI